MPLCCSVFNSLWWSYNTSFIVLPNPECRTYTGFPSNTSGFNHRVSIYADDMVLFLCPIALDLAFIKELLHCFGLASDLKTMCLNARSSYLMPGRRHSGHSWTLNTSCVVNFHAFICDSHLSVRKPNQGALELSLVRYVVTSPNGWFPLWIKSED